MVKTKAVTKDKPRRFLRLFNFMNRGYSSVSTKRALAIKKLTTESN